MLAKIGYPHHNTTIKIKGGTTKWEILKRGGFCKNNSYKNNNCSSFFKKIVAVSFQLFLEYRCFYLWLYWWIQYSILFDNGFLGKNIFTWFTLLVPFFFQAMGRNLWTKNLFTMKSHICYSLFWLSVSSKW